MTDRTGAIQEHLPPLVSVGWVSSPLQGLADCPRQPDEHAPAATITLRRGMEPANEGLDVGDEIIVVTWLDKADRATLTTRPRDDPDRGLLGVFATRSPDRPNPIGLHHTTITGLAPGEIRVSQLEALDGTPVVDIKPALGPIADR